MKRDYKELENTFEDLLAKVELVTESGCWIFHCAVSDTGYARARFNGKTVAMHRLFYERFVGPIPDGLDLDHLCRVRCCVNPHHVEPVTPKINTLRGHGRTAMNAHKTHCVYGHEFSGDNLRISKTGWRICLRCKAYHSVKRFKQEASR